MDEEYITNPTTGRPVKVNGRVWRSLKRHGLVESSIDTDTAESPEPSRPTDLEATLDALLTQDDDNDDVVNTDVCSLEGEEEEEEDGTVTYYYKQIEHAICGEPVDRQL